VKTLPPSAAVGSSTLANVLAFLGKGIEKVPLVGGPAVDVVKGVSKVRESAPRGVPQSKRTFCRSMKCSSARQSHAALAASSAIAAKTTAISSLAAGANRK
jgi:hypothetical protein